MFRLLGDWAPLSRDVSKYNVDDFIFLNIEGPIIKHAKFKEISKAGPIIKNNSFIKTNSKGVGILANNHLFDYGFEGYKETLNILKANKWFAVGAGISKKIAHEPLIINIKNTRIGILATCEIQFGLSQINKPGVAGFNTGIYKQIHDLKKKTDLIIISYHGAAEMLPWPSPNRQDLFRSFIDCGADIIYGHHTHIPQGWEKYNNGLIFYGLGNFCVDPINWSWHPNGIWSLAPEISYVNSKIKFKIKTTIIKDHGKKISVNDANKIEHKRNLSYLKKCNEPLKNRKLLEGLWQEASLQMYDSYYSSWLGYNSSKKLEYLKNYTVELINYLIPKKKNNFSLNKKNKLLLHYHMFACESHKDAISTALGLLCGEINDLRSKKTKKLINKWMIDSK